MTKSNPIHQAPGGYYTPFFGNKGEFYKFTDRTKKSNNDVELVLMR